MGGAGVPKFSLSNVRSIGFIPDLPAVLANVDIAIVPILHGSGTRLKMFDYMAARLPIVTTQKGAEGINIENREQAIIVDGVGAELINAIRFLIDNPEERKRIGASGRMLVEQLTVGVVLIPVTVPRGAAGCTSPSSRRCAR